MDSDGGFKPSIWTRGATRAARVREVSPRTRTGSDDSRRSRASFTRGQPPDRKHREQRADSSIACDSTPEETSRRRIDQQAPAPRSSSPLSPLNLTSTTARAYRSALERSRALQQPVPSPNYRTPSILTRSLHCRAPARGVATEGQSRTSIIESNSDRDSSNGIYINGTPGQALRRTPSDDAFASVVNPPEWATRLEPPDCQSSVITWTTVMRGRPTVPRRQSNDSESTTTSESSTSTISTSKFALESPSVRECSITYTQPRPCDPPWSRAWARKFLREQNEALDAAMRLSTRATISDAPTLAEEEDNHEELRSLVLSNIGSNCRTNSLLRIACPFCMFPIMTAEVATWTQEETRPQSEQEREQAEDSTHDDQHIRGRDRVHLWVLCLCLIACEIGMGCFIFFIAGANRGAILLAYIPSQLIMLGLVGSAFRRTPLVEDPERQPLLQRGGWRADDTGSPLRILDVEWRRSF